MEELPVYDVTCGAMSKISFIVSLTDTQDWNFHDALAIVEWPENLTQRVVGISQGKRLFFFWPDQPCRCRRCGNLLAEPVGCSAQERPT